MGTQESHSFNLLLGQEQDLENPEALLSVARKCIEKSKNEAEVLRGVEIVFSCYLKCFSHSQLEGEFFRLACLAAKNILCNKLKFLEGTSIMSNGPETSVETLNTCLKIISYLSGIFDHLNVNEKIKVTDVTSLLLNSSEVLYNCFLHCKTSEKVYGVLFTPLTEHLSNFFKHCCHLQEILINFLADKLICAYDNDELKILNELLTYLSKAGIVLIDLEVRMMAKVWKVYASLLERHFNCLKNDYNIDEIINELCLNIKNNIETVVFKDHHEGIKVIKLCCFLLKLIIKFCELFSGYLKKCQRSLLNLLCMLCKLNVSLEECVDNNLMKQLAIGSDPLLSQLITDEKLVKECAAASKNFQQSDHFLIFCCLVLKKLVHCETATKTLWLNKNENIVQWIFFAVSSNQFITCSDLLLPNVVVEGKYMKITGLYEYVLIASSAFLITSNAEEFYLIEKTLISNILQPHPVRALLAIDIWCLISRFGDPELCLSHSLVLSRIFQEFKEETLRVEKLYLASLLYRLFSLLTDTQKRDFLKVFHHSFYCTLWSHESCNLIPSSMSNSNCSFFTELNQFLCLHSHSPLPFETEYQGSRMLQESEGKIIKMWRFNCQILTSHSKSVKLLRITCALSSAISTNLSSENLYLILIKMRKLLSIGQPTSVQLFFIRVLRSFSTIRVPTGIYQKKILTFIADIFRDLLSSKQVFVKQKTLEAFYAFSHTTTHSEVIPLCVQNSPHIKLEVTCYFKKKPPFHANLNLGKYIFELHQLRFQHYCKQRQKEDERPIIKRIKSDMRDMQNFILTWKQDGQRILEDLQSLTESQKLEIKKVCNNILSSL